MPGKSKSQSAPATAPAVDVPATSLLTDWFEGAKAAASAPRVNVRKDGHCDLSYRGVDGTRVKTETTLTPDTVAAFVIARHVEGQLVGQAWADVRWNLIQGGASPAPLTVKGSSAPKAPAASAPLQDLICNACGTKVHGHPGDGCGCGSTDTVLAPAVKTPRKVKIAVPLSELDLALSAREAITKQITDLGDAVLLAEFALTEARQAAEAIPALREAEATAEANWQALLKDAAQRKIDADKAAAEAAAEAAKADAAKLSKLEAQAAKLAAKQVVLAARLEAARKAAKAATPAVADPTGQPVMGQNVSNVAAVTVDLPA